jgi:SAM-dependent methyltransferase
LAGPSPASYDRPAMSSGSLDAHASSYEEDIRRAIGFAGRDHRFFVEAKAKRLLEVAERHLGGLGDTSALDVGCGPGYTDSVLAGRLGELHGTDLSPAMLDRARETNPEVRYELAQAGRLPYADGRFDLVFGICVLHHVAAAERPGFCGELRRVARPGGLVVVFEHNPWHPLVRLAVHRCPFDEEAELVGRAEVRRLLAGTPLALVEDGFLLVTPWRGRVFARLDRALRSVPVGAQYLVAASRE